MKALFRWFNLLRLEFANFWEINIEQGQTKSDKIIFSFFDELKQNHQISKIK